MKEWICEEVQALTMDGKVISTFMHQIQELVRCKDCKFHIKPMEEDNVGDCLIKQGYFQVTDNWFCADAKRRDDDGQ